MRTRSRWLLGTGVGLLLVAFALGWAWRSLDGAPALDRATPPTARGANDRGTQVAPPARLHGRPDDAVPAEAPRRAPRAPAEGAGVKPSATTARGRPVRGRMLGPDGKPPENSEIYVVPKDASLRQPGFKPVRADADAGGRFLLSVEDLPDAWIVLRPDASSGLLRAFLDGRDVASGEPLDVVLERAPERTFRVTDLDGRPLARARIGVVPPDVSKIVTWPGPGEPTMGTWSTGTDTDGVWKVRLPERGPVRVTAKHEGHAPITRIVEPHEVEIDLRLPPSAVITIVIEDPPPGLYVGATATRLDGNAPSANATVCRASSREGRIEFGSNLSPGTYRVHVVAEGMEVVVVDGLEIAEFGEGIERTVRLEPALPTTGTIEIALPVTVGTTARTLFALVRSEQSPEAWVVRMPPWREPGAVELSGLHAGLTDAVVVDYEHDTAAVLTRVVVKAGERAERAPIFVPTFRATMPALGVDRDSIRRATLDLDRVDGLPLYQVGFRVSNIWMGSNLPSEGRPLGPFPGTTGTLRVELDDGTVRTFDLP